MLEGSNALIKGYASDWLTQQWSPMSFFTCCQNYVFCCLCRPSCLISQFIFTQFFHTVYYEKWSSSKNVKKNSQRIFFNDSLLHSHKLHSKKVFLSHLDLIWNKCGFKTQVELKFYWCWKLMENYNMFNKYSF